MKINCMIPARLGSKRVKRKNLRLMNGYTLPEIAANIAAQTKVFDGIYINSESGIFKEIAAKAGCKFYLRKPNLASDSASTDEVLSDFMLHRKADITFILNPTSPLMNPNELAEAVLNFKDWPKFNSIHSVVNHQVHSMFGNDTINFSKHEKLQRTQDLVPVTTMAFAFMGWRNNAFLDSYFMVGRGFWCPPEVHFPISKESAIDIDTEKDWEIAERMLSGTNAEPKYYDKTRIQIKQEIC